MSVEAEYKKLILEAKSYYESNPLELRNIRYEGGVFDFVWCEGLTDEINLWTYWQGVGVNSPEIMIIGQDFGNCNDDFYADCVKCSKSDVKKKSAEYIKRIRDNKNNKTDNTLIDLTIKGLGDKYNISIPGNEHVFMTNLCLGYRSVDKISGGTYSAYLKHDSLYISKLIRLKKPRAVICLGMDTYHSLLSAFVVERSVFQEIGEHFWELLDKGENYKDIPCDDFSFRMYGVSHAGSNGAMNRKKNCTRKDADKKSGNDLMIEDWKRIGQFLNA